MFFLGKKANDFDCSRNSFLRQCLMPCFPQQKSAHPGISRRNFYVTCVFLCFVFICVFYFYFSVSCFFWECMSPWVRVILFPLCSTMLGLNQEFSCRCLAGWLSNLSFYSYSYSYSHLYSTYFICSIWRFLVFISLWIFGKLPFSTIPTSHIDQYLPFCIIPDPLIPEAIHFLVFPLTPPFPFLTV